MDKIRLADIDLTGIELEIYDRLTQLLGRLALLDTLNGNSFANGRLPLVTNASVSNQTGFAADAYLAGSSIAINAGVPIVGSVYRLRFDMTKTAAGVAGPVLTLRYGTAGAVGDAAVLTFNFGAGTAAVDTGIFEVWAHFRTVGAAGVLTALARCTHNLAATGITSTGAAGVANLQATSAGFDTTIANSYLGASFNGGAAFAGTNTTVQAEGRNLNI